MPYLKQQQSKPSYRGKLFCILIFRILLILMFVTPALSQTYLLNARISETETGTNLKTKAGGITFEKRHFTSVYGVAATKYSDDTEITVYVIDDTFNRVIYNVNSASIEDFGKHVTDGGVLKNPRGVAADTNRNVYIANTYNNSISVWRNDNGTMTYRDELNSFGSYGSLNLPHQVAVDRDGAIYVADTYNDRILKLPSQQNSLTTEVQLAIGGTGTEAGKMMRPHGVSVNFYGEIFVADTANNRIQKFSSDGQFVKMITAEEMGLPNANFYNVATDGQGVYVTDETNEQVHKLDRDLNLILSYGGEQAGGEFDHPRGIAVYGGEMYVTEPTGGQWYSLGIEILDATVTDAVFSPFSANKKTTGIKYKLTDVARTRVIVYDPNGAPVKNLNANCPTLPCKQAIGVHQMYWDGTDENGVPVTLEGEYKITITAYAYNHVAEKTVSVTVDHPADINNLSVSPQVLNGSNPSAIFSYETDEENVGVTIQIWKQVVNGYVLVKSLFNALVVKGRNAVSWDGTDATSPPQKVTDGPYAFSIFSEKNGIQSVLRYVPVEVDFDVGPVSTDTTPPLITHTPVATAVEGSAVTLNATITDNVSVHEVTLFYRKIGQTTESYLPLTKSGDSYTATLPAGEVGAADIEYYLTASDGVNLSRLPQSSQRFYISTYTTSKQITLPGVFEALTPEPYFEWLAIGSNVTGHQDKLLTLSSEFANDDVRVFGYTGGGAFTQAGSLYDNYQNYFDGVVIAAGDFDGNGKDELVLSSRSGNDDVRIFKYQGGNFSLLSTLYDAYGTYADGLNVSAGDFDGDGKDEIVLSSRSGNDDVRIFKFQNGGFESWKQVYDAYGPYNEGLNVAAGDFDGDGKDELVLSAMRFNDHVQVFKYQNGNFTFWNQLADAYGPYNEGVNVAAGDFDGNGSDELVLSAMRFNDHVMVFEYSNGNFVMTGNLFDAYGPYSEGVNVTAGDFDGNGKDELVLSSMRSNDHVQVFQFENGNFLPFGSIYDVYGNYFEGVFVAAGDFDVSIARNIEPDMTFNMVKEVNANNYFINHALPAQWKVKAPFYPSVANPFTVTNPDVTFENKDYGSAGYTKQTDSKGRLLVGADGLFKARLVNNQGRMFVKIVGRFNVSAPKTYAIEYSANNGSTWTLIERSKFIQALPDPSTLAYWDVTNLNGAFLLRATLEGEEVHRIPVTIGEKITKVAGGAAKSPYQHVRLEFPPGAVRNDQFVTIYSRPDVTLPLGAPAPVGEVYEFSPPLTQSDFLQPAKAKFYYLDANNDGVIDGTNISESQLKIFRYDPPARLTALPDNRLDAQNNVVEAALDHFSLFVLLPVSDVTPPDISNLSVSPSPFSPNGDGKKDSAALSFFLSEEAYLTVKVVKGTGTTVRTLYAANALPGAQNILWDGKDDSGNGVLSGGYTFQIEAQDNAGNKKTASLPVTVDVTRPAAFIFDIHPAAFSPNNDGLEDTVTFSYALSETSSVTANVLNSANTVVYRFFITPKLQPPQLQNITWDGTGNTGEELYRLNVQVEDFAGNVSDVTQGYVLLDFGPPEIKNVSDSPDPFSPDNATSVGVKDTTVITAEIVENGNATWNLTIKDAANNPVRTFNGTTKQIQETWDGKNNSGNFVSDGTYTYVIQASDALGNSAEAMGTVSIDNTSPQTALSSGTPLFEATGRKYITPSTPLTLTAADPQVNGFASGISYVQYRVDGGSFVSYTGSAFTLSEGVHTVDYQSTDNVGNMEYTKSEIFDVDNTPPVSSLSIGTPLFEANGRHYITPSTPLTLSASDPVVASASAGVSRIEYKLDGGNYGTYTSTLTLSEGIHTVSYRSVDNVGNTETEISQTFSVDGTPPVTTLTPSSPLFNNLYAPLSTSYALSAVDPIVNGDSAGVMKIVYQIDGGAETQYTQPIVLTEGEHTITYYAKDNVLNSETPRSFTVRVDNTNPVTQFVPSAPLYANLYAPLSTTYTFTATDPANNGVSSGVDKIQYTLDGGGTQTFNGQPIALTEGIHTFVYAATDNVGNIEAQKSVTVYVDNTKPVTALTVGNPQYSSGGKLYISEKTTLSLTAFDPAAQSVSSGVSVIQYRMDGGNWNTYVSPFSLPEGVRLIDYRSIDNVQNTETAQSITLHVDGTVPETALSIGTPQCTVYANPVVTYATPFTLTPVDSMKNNVASGVNFTQYRLNSGNWQSYTGNFTIPTSFSDGTITIDFRSQDNVENLESFKTQVVILDNASPATQILSPQANSYTNNTIAVVGVVTDTYFADKGYYTVEYGSGSSPSNYTTIQSATYEQRNCNVDNPTCMPLTYWNTATVTQNQTYTVRVSSQDCVGNATSTQVMFKVGEPPFVLSFGTKSQGQQPNDGEFNEPAGLATIIANDGSENIAVADKQNHRIQIFSDKGQFITKFGQKAHGQIDGGEFNEPVELVTDSFGNLYVVDSLDDRVQKFDKNYAFIAAYGSHGNAQGQFIKPYGVVRDATGNLYVTDMQNNRLQKLDSNGNFIKEWTQVTRTTNGNIENFTFNKPSGVVIDSNGNLFVSDSQNDRIIKFTQDGMVLLIYEPTGQTQPPSSYGDHPLKQPLGIILDTFGNLYAADQMNHRVQKFDPWGFRLLNFGTKTQGNQTTDGTFNQVADVLLDSSQKFIYVSDIYNHRVQRFAIVTDAPVIAKLVSQKNEDKNAIITDPNLLNVLKVVSYPTPSRGKLSFNLEAEGNVTQITLEVYTINGKRVLTEFLPVQAAPASKGKGKFKAESPSLDTVLSSLPNGVYVYRLQISNGVKTVNRMGKFVVVK